MKKLMLMVLALLVLVAMPVLSLAQEAAMVDGVLTNIDPAVEEAMRYSRIDTLRVPSYYEKPFDEKKLQKVRVVTITADMLAKGQTSINLDALRFCPVLQNLTIDAGVPVESFEPLAQSPHLRRLTYVGVGETVDLSFLATCNTKGDGKIGIGYYFSNCVTTNVQEVLSNKAASRGRVGLCQASEQELLGMLENWSAKNLALSLDGCAVNDTVLAAIADKKITSLTFLNPTELGDLSVLSGAGVTSLTLEGVPNVELAQLSGFKKLETLSLNNCVLTGDFSELKKTALATLHIENQAIDIATLEGLSKLSNVELVGLSGIDLTVLTGLKKLTKLTLESLSEMDYAPIAGMAKLKELAILYPQQEAPDMSWLSDAKCLKNLQSLTLVQCGLNDDDVALFTGAKKLESLVLSHNHLTTTEGLSGFSKLTTLNLEGNPITDYSHLNVAKLEGTDDTTYEAIQFEFKSFRTWIASYDVQGTYNIAK